MEERFFLYDDTVATKTRFVSFMGENERHDLALLYPIVITVKQLSLICNAINLQSSVLTI